MRICSFLAPTAGSYQERPRERVRRLLGPETDYLADDLAEWLCNWVRRRADRQNRRCDEIAHLLQFEAPMLYQALQMPFHDDEGQEGRSLHDAALDLILALILVNVSLVFGPEASEAERQRLFQELLDEGWDFTILFRFAQKPTRWALLKLQRDCREKSSN